MLFLFKALDWREAIRLFDPNISLQSLALFGVLASAIAWMYGLRWNWFLDGALRTTTYLVASLLSIGGNMFLPARGGDLLRVHYSHVAGQVSHATALSRLLIEKIVDLITIALIGALAVLLLSRSGENVNSYFLGAALAGVLAVAGAILLVKFGSAFLLRWLHRVFGLIGRSERIERNLTHLIQDIGQKLTLSLTLKPGLLTITMWLAVYVPSYMLISRMVGVNLAYHEAMLVLFAAALGLMIPAAPSGIGTFHASVVSAFLFLGRPAAEGLLVGTAIHLFFLIAYATPAALLSGVWLFNRKALR
jgi:uncharacterized membrane protein YbhN (UPF0104 family)